MDNTELLEKIEMLENKIKTLETNIIDEDDAYIVAERAIVKLVRTSALYPKNITRTVSKIDRLLKMIRRGLK